MIKTKYDKLTKDEKKKIIEKYKKTDAGLAMMNRLTRLLFTGIVGIVLAIGLFIYEYKTIEMTDYLILVPLFFASILFIMMSFKLKRKVLNQFMIKNK